MSDPAPPQQFVDDCAALGFQIGGWDATTAGVFGHGVEFVGTHAETMAFLRGFLVSQEVNPRVVARYVLSMSTGATRIPPDYTFQVISRPQRCPFRGDRIAIVDSIAAHFTILDVSVGNRSQFIQAGSVDGTLFRREHREAAAVRVRRSPPGPHDARHRGHDRP